MAERDVPMSKTTGHEHSQASATANGREQEVDGAKREATQAQVQDAVVTQLD